MDLSKHCRERNEKVKNFFSSSFAIDGSLCTHNPIHSFTLSGHFTKSEKKKIDCPEKTGYWLDVQYTELCKMATAKTKSLLSFFSSWTNSPRIPLTLSFPYITCYSNTFGRSKTFQSGSLWGGYCALPSRCHINHIYFGFCMKISFNIECF